MIVCTNRAWSQTPLADTQHRAAVSLAPRVSSGYTPRLIPCSLCLRPLALVRGRAGSSQHAETLLRSSRILLLLAVCVRVCVRICRRIPVGCLVAVRTTKKNQQAGRRAVCGGGRCCHCVASSTAGRRLPDKTTGREEGEGREGGGEEEGGRRSAKPISFRSCRGVARVGRPDNSRPQEGPEARLNRNASLVAKRHQNPQHPGGSRAARRRPRRGDARREHAARHGRTVRLRAAARVKSAPFSAGTWCAARTTRTTHTNTHTCTRAYHAHHIYTHTCAHYARGAPRAPRALRARCAAHTTRATHTHTRARTTRVVRCAYHAHHIYTHRRAHHASGAPRAPRAPYTHTHARTQRSR